MRRFLMSLALLPLLGGTVMAQDDFNAMDVPALIATAPSIHPAGLYVLAGKLFADGKKDEAVFWFYAGQLRYRVHLACHKDLDPSGDPALFGALSETVGRPLNEYGFGDIPVLAETLDKVIAWDKSTPDGFTDRKTCPEADGVRDGLIGLRDQIVSQADDIRTQRKANGLENR
jgi:hypothetical protein